MDFNLTEDQLVLQRTLKEFVEHEVEPVAAQLDTEGRIPDHLIKKLVDLRLLGMVLPEEYGGTGAGHLNCVLACEQLAYSGTPVWWPVAFNNSIPFNIYQFGTAEQRRKFLPAFCDGTSIASIQFTEEDTGSDPDALKTTAIPDGDYYTINGSKRFSTFGARDGYAVVYAKDDTGRCSAFIVKKKTPGYTVQKVWELMGGGGVEATDVSFENLKVSQDDLLGGKGKGFQVLLNWIATEKIEQASAAVGIGQAALDEAIKYARSRMVRGKPMSEMQGIRWMLAEMKAKIEAARLMTYRAAFLQDYKKVNWMTEAAATKIFVVPAMMEVVEMSRRIHGAYGYTKGMKIERLYRAIPGASVIAVGLEINKSQVAASILQ